MHRDSRTRTNKFFKEKQLTGIMLAVVKENETNIVDQSLLFEEIKTHSDIQIKSIFRKPRQRH